MKFNLSPSVIPKHVAFIMDGNGRWAKKHNLPRKLGHRQGVKTLEHILDIVYEMGIEYVSIFAFSTENSTRPPDEVAGLKALMEENISKLSNRFIKRGIRLNVMGDLTFFSDESAQEIRDLVKQSSQGTKGVLNFGLNYGGRAEIVNAVNKAIKLGVEVTLDSFPSLLDTADLPDPDLIIRTGSQLRLSNFMLYQSAYSELYFCDCLWPDFDKEQLIKCLDHYSKRTRKYGGVVDDDK